MTPRYTLTFTLCLAAAACSRAVDMDSARAERDTEKAPVVRARTQVAAPAPRPPERLDDAAITGKVRAGLAADPAMAGADISVNTQERVVNLTGLVKTQEQAALAAAHGNQDGVLRVDNHLAVDLR